MIIYLAFFLLLFFFSPNEKLQPDLDMVATILLLMNLLLHNTSDCASHPTRLDLDSQTLQEEVWIWRVQHKFQLELQDKPSNSKAEDL